MYNIHFCKIKYYSFDLLIKINKKNYNFGFKKIRIFATLNAIFSH